MQSEIELRAEVAALLRIVIQSFDSGGESMRSQRAQAVEAAWFLLTRGHGQMFADAYRRCDEDRWAAIARARMSAA